MKNKKDIVELVQLYNVDHVFRRLKFRYKLDYTKYIDIINKGYYSRKVFLTPNFSWRVFDKSYLFKRIWFSERIGSGNGRYSLENKV